MCFFVDPIETSRFHAHSTFITHVYSRLLFTKKENTPEKRGAGPLGPPLATPLFGNDTMRREEEEIGVKYSTMASGVVNKYQPQLSRDKVTTAIIVHSILVSDN